MYLDKADLDRLINQLEGLQNLGEAIYLIYRDPETQEIQIACGPDAIQEYKNAS